MSGTSVNPVMAMTVIPPFNQGYLYIFISNNLDELHELQKGKYSPSLRRIDCILNEKIYSFGCSPWQSGAYGLICFQERNAALNDFCMSTQSAKDLIDVENGIPLGAMMFPCAARGQTLYEENGIECDHFNSLFPGISLSGKVQRFITHTDKIC